MVNVSRESIVQPVRLYSSLEVCDGLKVNAKGSNLIELRRWVNYVDRRIIMEALVYRS